ncbi:MAG: hypothetical protein AAF611_08250 [Bacteroidota bacterium]
MIPYVREDEYVKIVGKATNFETALQAPISKRSCVYYHVIVERRAHKSWIKIIDDELFQNFHIVADGEKALINLNLSRKNCKVLNIVSDHAVDSNLFKDASEAFEQYLNTQNTDSKNLLGLNRELRYTERIIEIDEEIAVMGIGKWKNDSKNKSTNEKQLMLYGTEKRKLYVTDDPKAMKQVRRN